MWSVCAWLHRLRGFFTAMMIMRVRLAKTPRQPRQVSRMAETRCSWATVGQLDYEGGGETRAQVFTIWHLFWILASCQLAVSTLPRASLSMKHLSPGGECLLSPVYWWPTSLQTISRLQTGWLTFPPTVPSDCSQSSSHHNQVKWGLTSHASKPSLHHHGHRVVALSLPLYLQLSRPSDDSALKLGIDLLY